MNFSRHQKQHFKHLKYEMRNHEYRIAVYCDVIYDNSYIYQNVVPPSQIVSDSI